LEIHFHIQHGCLVAPDPAQTPAGGHYVAYSSSAGTGDYYSANTGSAQSATATLPSATQPRAVYATLGSFISGTWRTNSYSYQIGLSPPSGTPIAALALGTPTAPCPQIDPVTGNHADWFVLNDNSQVPLPYAIYDNNTHAFLDPSRLDNFKVLPENSGVSIVSISLTSACPTDNFEVTFQAGPTAASGPRDLTFTWGGQARTISGAVTVDDATPQIQAIQQNPPTSAGGPFSISIYGTNFGPSPGSVEVCAQGANPCNGTPDLSSLVAATNTWSDNRIDQMLAPSPNASGVYDVRVTSGGETPAMGFQSAPKGKTNAQSNAGQVEVAKVQITARPITITSSTTIPGTYVATLTSIASPPGGVYTWTTNNSNMVGFLTASSSPNASQVTLGITSTNDNATITLTYFGPRGGMATDSFTFALTNDTTVIGWVDRSPVDIAQLYSHMLASNPNTTLPNDISHALTCRDLLLGWKDLGYLSASNGVGRGANGLTDAERQYANGYLIYNSANTPPSQTITSSADVMTAGNYRVYQRFQASYEISGGVVVPLSDFAILNWPTLII
jgi:hypothetical protein